jgi:uncharacterized protein (DUF4415 family)
MEKTLENQSRSAHPSEIIPPGKTRITIRLDKDVVEWFRQQVEQRGGGNYQTMINLALRQHVHSRQTSFEDMLRRVLREEIQKKGISD